MEYFDILDKNGRKTGKTKLRKEVHKDGDWHGSVDIWILNDKKEILLQKRAKDKDSFPSLWELSCSGHIAAGEKNIKAAIRELEEEVGIKAKKKIWNIYFPTKNHTLQITVHS